MSRSRKKVPICGITCARSDKQFKSHEHRRARRLIRSKLPDEEGLPHPKEFGNRWAAPKDGRQFVRSPEMRIRIMRK